MARPRGEGVNSEFWPLIIARLEGGEQPSAVADAYGISPSAISQHLRRHGIVITGMGRHGKRVHKMTRRVELASGGMVQILCTTPQDFLMLSPVDRAFVEELFERLSAYHGARGEIGYEEGKDAI